MKKLLILIIGILLMGCSTPPKEEEKNDDTPIITIIDLSHYSYFSLEMGPLDGNISWNWSTTDLDYCERNPVDYSILKVFREDSRWEKDAFYFNSSMCFGDGIFEAVSNNTEDVDDHRIFYEFRWQCVVKISYTLTVG
jgi:hypothetical protein